MEAVDRRGERDEAVTEDLRTRGRRTIAPPPPPGQDGGLDPHQREGSSERQTKSVWETGTGSFTVAPGTPAPEGARAPAPRAERPHGPSTGTPSSSPAPAPVPAPADLVPPDGDYDQLAATRTSPIVEPAGESDLVSGSGLSRFRVLRRHARGGIGQVSVALDAELHREVALKEILPERADDPDSRSRFLLEAEVTGRLEHPGIVPVYALGMNAQGRPFYAMRFVKGQSLKEAVDAFHAAAGASRHGLRGRTLEFRKLLGQFMSICNAVSYAHSRGVIHRDLKPSNVLLGPYGETLVVDWGLAKVVGREAPAPREYNETTLRPAAPGSSTETVAGSVAGTPAFMSPEQAAGDLERLGPASDVYSLGAILYYALTGVPPIRASSLADVFDRARRGDFPPPRAVNRRVPRELDAVCRMAMALRPEARYATARALAADVEKWMADEPVAAFPEGRGRRLMRLARRHRAWTGAGAVALLLISLVSTLALGVVRRSWQEESRQRDRALRLLDESQTLSATLALDRAFGSFDEERVGDGLLWLARALQSVPADRPDLEHVVRANLANWRPRIAFQRGVFEHRGHIDAVVFSPDGKLVLTGSEDRTAQLWDAATGTAIGPPIKHAGNVAAAVFSPDGLYFLTGSGMGTAQRRAVKDGRPVGPPLGESVRAAAFRPDGRAVVLGGAHAARLFDLETGEPLGPPLQHTDDVVSVAFAPDGRTVVTASHDKTAQIWDPVTGERVGGPLTHEAQVQDVAFSPDGTLVLTGSWDKTARAWEAATGKPKGEPLKHRDSVKAVAFSPNGRTMLTASDDKTARLWDTATGQPAGAPMVHPEFVDAVAFRPDGLAVLTSGWDHAARLWDVSTLRHDEVVLKHGDYVKTALFSPDGSVIATCSDDHTAALWDPETGKQRVPPLRHENFVNTLVFSPDGERVLTASNDRTARIWDVTRGAPLGEPMWHGDFVESAVFSPAGRTVLTASKDSTAQLWDATTCQRIGPPLVHKNRVVRVAFSPDGKTVLTGSDDYTAQLWNAATGHPIGPRLAHEHKVFGVAFSPDGRLALTTSRDRSARLWEAASGQPVGQPLMHQGIVFKGVFSRDGRRLLTCSLDGTARQWDVATGEPIGPPLEHAGQVNSAVYSPDGKMIATASNDKTARVWDATTGLPLGPPLQHADKVYCVSFSPDGRRVITGGWDDTARVWDIVPPLQGSVEQVMHWVHSGTNLGFTSGHSVKPMSIAAWREHQQKLATSGGDPTP